MIFTFICHIYLLRNLTIPVTVSASLGCSDVYRKRVTCVEPRSTAFATLFSGVYPVFILEVGQFTIEKRIFSDEACFMSLKAI